MNASDTRASGYARWREQPIAWLRSWNPPPPVFAKSMRILRSAWARYRRRRAPPGRRARDHGSCLLAPRGLGAGPHRSVFPSRYRPQIREFRVSWNGDRGSRAGGRFAAYV